MLPPAVCRSVTAPGRLSTTPASRALLRSHPNTACRKMSRMAVDNPGAKPGYRNESGSVSTHCRTGTCGSTRSTRFAAVSAMRRPPQLGQKPRPFHENATRDLPPARLAPEPPEAVRKDPALEVGVELPLYEGEHPRSPATPPGPRMSPGVPAPLGTASSAPASDAGSCLGPSTPAPRNRQAGGPTLARPCAHAHVSVSGGLGGAPGCLGPWPGAHLAGQRARARPRGGYPRPAL